MQTFTYILVLLLSARYGIDILVAIAKLCNLIPHTFFWPGSYFVPFHWSPVSGIVSILGSTLCIYILCTVTGKIQPILFRRDTELLFKLLALHTFLSLGTSFMAPTPQAHVYEAVSLIQLAILGVLWGKQKPFLRKLRLGK